MALARTLGHLRCWPAPSRLPGSTHCPQNVRSPSNSGGHCQRVAPASQAKTDRENGFARKRAFDFIYVASDTIAAKGSAGSRAPASSGKTGPPAPLGELVGGRGGYKGANNYSSVSKLSPFIWGGVAVLKWRNYNTGYSWAVHPGTWITHNPVKICESSKSALLNCPALWPRLAHPLRG